MVLTLSVEEAASICQVWKAGRFVSSVTGGDGLLHLTTLQLYGI